MLENILVGFIECIKAFLIFVVMFIVVGVPMPLYIKVVVGLSVMYAIGKHNRDNV